MYEKLYKAIKEHGKLEDDDIIDAASHGADSGFNGFTYTSDCTEFYAKNKEAIWELLCQSADDQGVKPLALVASFGRSDMAANADGFENLLAWFALEEVGRWLEQKAEEKA